MSVRYWRKVAEDTRRLEIYPEVQDHTGTVDTGEKSGTIILID